MNKIKVMAMYVMALIVSLGFSIQMMAQGQGNSNPEMRMQNRIAKMKQNLNLTDDQVSKVTAIYKESQQKMMALKNSGADQQTIHAQRQDLMKMADTQITAILTPDQQQKWQTMKANMKANRGNRNPGE